MRTTILGFLFGAAAGSGATWAVMRFGWPSTPWLIVIVLAVALIGAIWSALSILNGIGDGIGRAFGWK